VEKWKLRKAPKKRVQLKTLEMPKDSEKKNVGFNGIGERISKLHDKKTALVAESNGAEERQKPGEITRKNLKRGQYSASTRTGKTSEEEVTTQAGEASKSEAELFQDKRILCSDGNCIGVIGPDGRCSECGKPIEEAREESKRRGELRDAKMQEAAARQRRKRKVKIGLYTACSICLFGFVWLIFSDSIDTVSKPDVSKPKSPPNEWTSVPAPTGESSKRAENSPKKPAEDSLQEAVSYDRYLTKAFFEKSNLGRNNIVRLQTDLAILGYKPGQADGIIGNKTLTAVKQFSNDFRPEVSQLNASNLVALVNYHAIVASAHPDWCKLRKGGVLIKWLEKKPEGFRKDVEQHVSSGDPKAIIGLLNWYKFEKEKPTPLPLPSTGIVKRSFHRGLAPLSIKTKYADQHHYIKLIDFSNKKEILTAFIRGGATLSVDVPLGNCELKAAVGKTWYGEKFLFGPNTIYSKADETFDFTVKGNQVHGYTIELFLQPHGNLSTSKISPFDF